MSFFPLEFSCVFRFPSTNIRLEFQSLIESKHHHHHNHRHHNHMEKDCLNDDNHHHQNNNNKSIMLTSSTTTTTNSNGQSSKYYSPLKVNIPEIATNLSNNSDFVSPIPSPTGTIR